MNSSNRGLLAMALAAGALAGCEKKPARGPAKPAAATPAATMAPTAPAAPAAKVSDASAIQGAWVPVGMSPNDPDFKLISDLEFEFIGNTLVLWTSKREPLRQGGYTLDWTKSPKSFDCDVELMPLLGPGVYTLEGDRMQLAFGLSKRPAAVARDGQKHKFLELKRIRKANELRKVKQ